MSRRALYPSFGILFTLLALTAGCKTPELLRMQADDENEKDRYDVKTIGDVSSIANMADTVVGGVGLVVDLDDTGGNPPPGGYKETMMAELRKRGETHVKEILDSKKNALVLVTAVIRAGAHKGDVYDVEVTLPPGSGVKSLRGGYLKEIVLRDFDSAKNLSPDTKGGDRALAGNPCAKAEGPVQAGWGAGEDDVSLKRGIVWGGARCVRSFPIYIALEKKYQFARMAQAAADRINETFHGVYQGGPSTEMAKAFNKEAVLINVPHQYHTNLERYVRVMRLIPLREKDRMDDMLENRLASSNASAVQASTRLNYRRRLEEELLNPKRTITAALRLEALGEESVPALKRGMASEHALVRFASAEALAYLGNPASGEELAKLVEDYPPLRAFCLAALGSLDEAVCHVKLRELQASSSPEVRYGAFRALRTLDERDDVVQGEYLNESFFLHRVAPNTTPLVHISGSRRAEIVLYGIEPSLVAPFQIVAGEFNITAGADADHCTISRFSLHRRGVKRLECSLKLNDVIHALADPQMGGMYADVVELIRQADKCRCLTSPVAVDALPQATTVFDLVKEGRRGAAEQEIQEARGELNATPTLFEKIGAVKQNKPADADRESLLADPKSKDEKKTAEHKDKAPWARSGS